MSVSAAGIIFSSLNSNTLSRLTRERTVAAIPFACRYKLIDFCLSNMVNANISNINIVANYNYRSLLEHIGSGKDWDLARRERAINFISPFQTSSNHDPKIFSTRLEALKSMKEYISEFQEEFVVLMDADTVLNFDLGTAILKHERSGADVTLISKTISDGYSAKHPRMMLSAPNDKICSIAMSSLYNRNHPDLALGIFIMRTEYLRKLIEEAEAYRLNSFTGLIIKTLKNSSYYVYRHNSYVATVSSFLDYYKASMDIACNENARESLLGRDGGPIFTRVHNSAPTTYGDSSLVTNSLIADDCIIDGTVIDSVISRGVRIERGAVVKNSVLFKGTRVGERASVNCIVADKDTEITRGVLLSGNMNMPFYIERGRRV